jgi:hypothetical protein
MSNESIATRGPDINLQAGCPTNVDAPLDYSKKNQQVLAYDWSRAAQVGITGWTLTGPISHVWYGVLERLVKTRHYYGGLVLRMLLLPWPWLAISVGEASRKGNRSRNSKKK